MPAKLYSIPGSHPAMAGRLMLERKGIPYKRVDLIAAAHKPILKALRFSGSTVPAIKLEDGRKIQGTREIARVLDEIVPEPPLFPADPEARAKVEEAERWGDEVLQSMPRRIAWQAIDRNREGMAGFLEDAKLPVPKGLALKTAGPIIKAEQKINNSTEDTVRADLAALPGAIDKVDAYIADGVLNGAEPNAADYQIAVSTRLLLNFEDLAPLLEGRPAADHARRIVPDFPGHVPPALPADWLAPVVAATAS
ncbi:MAG: glutathione S-transferase family protein [Thermoleophilaceae bacterium]|nr:glutathione S-transferase family protein [Thermoleophilaceae bacterium]